MRQRAVHVLVFEGFADWEPAHALAELRRSGKRNVAVVGFSREPVTSMGGLRVIPDHAIADIRVADVELLILPGGDLWEGDYPRAALEALLADLAASGVTIAAICAATLAVARAGLLNERRHTSNMPGYLSDNVPEYAGASLYQDAPAVNDGGVITATGLAPVDFARVIFREFGVFSTSDEQLWFDMFKHGQLPQPQ